MSRTTIAWTDESLNLVTGCSRVSEGCRHCYAEVVSHKWKWTDKPWTAVHAIENVVCHPERLLEPVKRRKPTKYFIASMGDIFHERVPDEFLVKVFTMMNDTQRHTYQFLTKRPERAAEWPGPWAENIWMGTTVEHGATMHRVETLRRCPAHVRFISAEPLLGDLGRVDLRGIHQVIVGGESGPSYRPMDHDWARGIRDQCVAQQVAFFFKQDAGTRPGMRPWLVEADGSRWQWHQYPNQMSPPQQLCLPQIKV